MPVIIQRLPFLVSSPGVALLGDAREAGARAGSEVLGDAERRLALAGGGDVGH